MAIRDRFLAVLAGFALVFLPGTPAPVDAESGFSDLADAIPLEPVAIPPPLDDFERLPPGEATAEASGAVPGPAGIPEAIEPAPEIDPWAEAFAESARPRATPWAGIPVNADIPVFAVRPQRVAAFPSAAGAAWLDSLGRAVRLMQEPALLLMGLDVEI